MKLETFANNESQLSVREKLNRNVIKLGGRASFTDNTTQKPISTTPEQIQFDVTEISSTIVTNNNGEFTFNENYVYEIVTGFQVERTVSGGGIEEIIIWTQLDTGVGWVDVPRSAVEYALDGAVSTVISLNALIDASHGDKFRYMVKVTNASKGMGLVTKSAGVDYPSIPSAILTIT